MKKTIEDIKIGTRIRVEIGDISALKESIQKIGLINPIIVNEKNELLSGFRRLEACRQLGWIEVEFKIFDSNSDKVQELDLEYHENLGRMDLSPQESEQYLDKRYQLLHPPKPENIILAWIKKLWEKIKNLFGIK